MITKKARHFLTKNRVNTAPGNINLSDATDLQADMVHAAEQS